MTICSDSKAALNVLAAAKVTSNLVAEVIEAVNKVSICNSVRHYGVPRSEIVDGLVKQAASTSFISPQPEFGIKMFLIAGHMLKPG